MHPWHVLSFMSNLPVVHCLALGATKREFLRWSSSSTELSLLLSTEEVSLESIDINESVSSAESRLSLFCNKRRLELPRTPLLLLLPILVVGRCWMVWAETMTVFIDKDTTKLRRNNFTVLDEIMVMPFLSFDLTWDVLCRFFCVWLLEQFVTRMLFLLSFPTTF